MRNPERIKRICDALYSCWIQNPDSRLGQLISNINYEYGHSGDIFFPEDEMWEAWIKNFKEEF